MTQDESVVFLTLFLSLLSFSRLIPFFNLLLRMEFHDSIGSVDLGRFASGGKMISCGSWHRDTPVDQTRAE